MALPQLTAAVISSFLGGEVPCLLGRVRADFGQEMQMAARREECILDAVGTRDVKRLSKYTAGMDTAVFDAAAPPEYVKDVERVHSLLAGHLHEWQKKAASWLQRSEKAREAVMALPLHSETSKLNLLQRQQRERLFEASERIEEMTSTKDRLKQGFRKLLLKAGVEGAEKLDAEAALEKWKELKARRFQEHDKIVGEVVASILPDPSLRQKLEEERTRAALLDELQQEAQVHLAEQQNLVAKQQVEANGLAELAASEEKKLQAHIDHCRKREDETIDREAHARLLLEDVIKKFFTALQHYEQRKAEREVARIKLGDLERQRNRFKQLVVEVMSTTATIRDESCAWLDKAVQLVAGLEEARQATVTSMNADDVKALEAAVTNCQCASSLLGDLITRIELDKKDLLVKIEDAEARAESLAEHACDFEKYQQILDEVQDLRRELLECEARLQRFGAQKREVDVASEPFLSMGCHIEKNRAHETADQFSRDAFRCLPPLHAPKSSQRVKR